MTSAARSLKPHHLKCLSEEGPLLCLGPLNTFQTQLNLLSGCCLHVQEEVQQRADQAGSLGLADGDQERPHKLQQTTELWEDTSENVRSRQSRGVL